MLWDMLSWPAATAPGYAGREVLPCLHHAPCAQTVDSVRKRWCHGLRATHNPNGQVMHHRCGNGKSGRLRIPRRIDSECWR